MRKYLNRYLTTGQPYTLKPKGAKRKLTEAHEQTLKETAIRNNFATNSQLRNMIEEFPVVSANTISNYLKKYGIKSRVAAQT